MADDEGFAPGAPLPEDPGVPSAFSDVPSGFWAKTAIDHVASSHDWMRDFGTSTFQPETVESRKLLARALVKAFDPNGNPSSSITFTDLPASDPFFRDANVAVKDGFMFTVEGTRKFLPDKGAFTSTVHRAVVGALGLQVAAAGLRALHTARGTKVNPARNFEYMNLGMTLGLRYNHANEAEDVRNDTVLHRDEVAWSLWRATTLPSWTRDAQSKYANITLGAMSNAVFAAVRFATAYVGYPYVYAGEWWRASPSGYCCGFQATGGFDCSGLMWWTLKSPAGGYDNTFIRPYRGWRLPERSSSSMGGVGAHVSYSQLRPGDLMFYDSSSSSGISHVDVYLGNGWALDSSSGGQAGVAIIDVSSGYYRDHFRWGRRLALA